MVRGKMPSLIQNVQMNCHNQKNKNLKSTRTTKKNEKQSSISVLIELRFLTFVPLPPAIRDVHQSMGKEDNRNFSTQIFELLPRQSLL